LLLETIDPTIEQFSMHFEQYRKLGDLKYVSNIQIQSILKIKFVFDNVLLYSFEMQLLELKSNSIWKQK